MDFHISSHFYFKTATTNNTKIGNFFCFLTQKLLRAHDMSNNDAHLSVYNYLSRGGRSTIIDTFIQRGRRGEWNDLVATVIE